MLFLKSMNSNVAQNRLFYDNCKMIHLQNKCFYSILIHTALQVVFKS